MTKKPKPSGFGKIGREEHARRVREGKAWHEAKRLSDLKRMKDKMGDADGRKTV